MLQRKYFTYREPKCFSIISHKHNLLLVNWYISYTSDCIFHKACPKGALCGSDVNRG